MNLTGINYPNVAAPINYYYNHYYLKFYFYEYCRWRRWNFHVLICCCTSRHIVFLPIFFFYFPYLSPEYDIFIILCNLPSHLKARKKSFTLFFCRNSLKFERRITCNRHNFFFNLIQFNNREYVISSITMYNNEILNTLILFLYLNCIHG